MKVPNKRLHNGTAPHTEKTSVFGPVVVVLLVLLLLLLLQLLLFQDDQGSKCV